jgi:hypothetical protein
MKFMQFSILLVLLFIAACVGFDTFQAHKPMIITALGGTPSYYVDSHDFGPVTATVVNPGKKIAADGTEVLGYIVEMGPTNVRSFVPMFDPEKEAQSQHPMQLELHYGPQGDVVGYDAIYFEPGSGKVSAVR